VKTLPYTRLKQKGRTEGNLLKQTWNDGVVSPKFCHACEIYSPALSTLNLNFTDFKMKHGYIVTDNQLIPQRRVHIEKPLAAQLIEKFSTFYGTYRFIIVFIRAGH
jgi:hypothetical protein